MTDMHLLTNDLATDEEINVNDWTRRSRKEGVCCTVALTSQPLNVKNAPIVTVQNIFPRILTYYQMATLNILD
jgi:hypothetical protein